MSDMLTVQIDQKSIDKARRTLAKYQGRPLMERLQRGSLQGARMLVTPIRSGAPVRIGRLRASVRAAKSRSGGGGIVGPTDYKRHLIIRGHRIVTPGGRDTGRRTAANPFVDAAVQPRLSSVMAEITKILNEP